MIYQIWCRNISRRAAERAEAEASPVAKPSPCTRPERKHLSAPSQMPTTRILPLATSTNQGFVISDTFIPAKRSEGNAITNLWLRPDSSPDPSLRATLHRPFKSSANSQTSPSPKSVISSEISPAVCVLLHTPLAPANAARFARGIPSRAPIGSSATELSRYASKTLPPLLYKCGGKSISQ